MAYINVPKLMQDEGAFFKFILESPQHFVVLNVIAKALETYSRVLPVVVASGDVAKQQDLATIFNFLKREATDRVCLREENIVLDGVERLLGDAARDELLALQKARITEMLATHASLDADQGLMQQLFEAAGWTWAPSWGQEFGSANIGQHIAVRMSRHEEFHASREAKRLYFLRKHEECRANKIKADEAHARVVKHSEIAFRTSVFKMIRDIHGEEQAHVVLNWAKTTNRLSEYCELRDRINAMKLPCRIHSRPRSEDVRRSA